MALVFDDGPVAADVLPLLDVLAAEGARATFSLVGERVDADPASARAIAAAGHEIANHSHTHAHPSALSDEALGAEVRDAQRSIAAAVGSAPRWYWPPYLEVDDRLRSAVAQAGLEIYPAGHVAISRDYDRSVDARQIRLNATRGVRDGSVILFHEWRLETRLELPSILSDLRSAGFSFLTLSGCLAAAGGVA